MELHLDVEVTDRAEGSAPLGVRMVARTHPSEVEKGIPLTLSCESLEDLERAILALKDRMDRLLLEARAIFERDAGTPRDAPRTPEALWAAMERDGSLEEMKRIFNGLDSEKRLDLANHIFTHTNIFKGAASLFSQHFNENACTLE